MSKAFLDQNFLLQTKTAERLYHDYAKVMPIIDYHNHLPPDAILEDSNFKNITQGWLYGDHYKWRAMRSNGINEKYCTGDATDIEKFNKWAETVPYTMRNPLYHWTHLELQRYFNINEVLNADSAKKIYETASDLLNTKAYSIRNLLGKLNVTTLCTTDDPLDSLEHHIAYKKDTDDSKDAVVMLPAFRPDKFILIENANFNTFIDKLGVVVNSEINSYQELTAALTKRMHFFASVGCKVSDHGLERLSASPFTEDDLQKIFLKKRSGQALSEQEIEAYKSGILHFLGTQYHAFGWIQQYHLGAMRNNNLRAMRTLGPDTGWDSIGDYAQARNLSTFLGKLDENNQLAQTIIYNLNPADNDIMGTMIGNFNDGSVAGKVQWGSGWWFLDQKDGMEKQINSLSNLGLLSRFIGMLTDSRSFLSFPRHEYFRRILCNIYGNDIENGELPNDIAYIGKTIQDICYNNAKNYFGFEK
jgi:glucuronate isomerase